MDTKIKNKEVYFGLAALIGLILIIILATVLTPGSVYEGNLSLNPSATQCSSIGVTSIPAPLKSGQGAFIIIKSVPQAWEGAIRVSASEGILNDGYGNEGSIIETNEKIISYGGGAENERITVQAVGSDNEQCLGTLAITGDKAPSCLSLKIVTDPVTVTQNQSAVLTLITAPEDYSGTFLIQSDSGIFQLTSADPNAQGENTGTLVTTGKSVIYNGGKAGEKIHISALGGKNAGCKETLEIKR
jgi:hypothetical protein